MHSYSYESSLSRIPSSNKKNPVCPNPTHGKLRWTRHTNFIMMYKPCLLKQAQSLQPAWVQDDVWCNMQGFRHWQGLNLFISLFQTFLDDCVRSKRNCTVPKSMCTMMQSEELPKIHLICSRRKGECVRAESWHLKEKKMHDLSCVWRFRVDQGSSGGENEDSGALVILIRHCLTVNPLN